MMKKMCRILVSGLVQGIGFRPFVAELAEALQLEGQVKNLGGIVEIFVSGESQAVDMFIQRLRSVGECTGTYVDNYAENYVENCAENYTDKIDSISKNKLNRISQEITVFENKMTEDTNESGKDRQDWKLPGCRIDSFEVATYIEQDGKYHFSDRNRIEQNGGCCSVNKNQTGQNSEIIAEIFWNGKFHIVESQNTRELRRFLPVDLPVCDRCIEELHDPSNRRYRYPFISCTSCGPRFSIQKSVPYDRETITMNDFPMCESCRQEYTQKGNIRRHAQTIACSRIYSQVFFVENISHSTGKFVRFFLSNITG